MGGNQVYYRGTPFAWLSVSNGYGSGLSIRGDGSIETWTTGTLLSGSGYTGTYSVSSSLQLIGASDYDPMAVPEPGSLALMGLGLTALGYAARRRKKA